MEHHAGHGLTGVVIIPGAYHVEQRAQVTFAQVPLVVRRQPQPPSPYTHQAVGLHIAQTCPCRGAGPIWILAKILILGNGSLARTSATVASGPLTWPRWLVGDLMKHKRKLIAAQVPLLAAVAATTFWVPAGAAVAGHAAVGPAREAAWHSRAPLPVAQGGLATAM